MGYNIRIPLGFGELKIKSYSWLRPDERNRQAPVRRIGRTYFVWRSSRKAPVSGQTETLPLAAGGAAENSAPRQ